MFAQKNDVSLTHFNAGTIALTNDTVIFKVTRRINSDPQLQSCSKVLAKMTLNKKKYKSTKIRHRNIINNFLLKIVRFSIFILHKYDFLSIPHISLRVIFINWITKDIICETWRKSLNEIYIIVDF